MVNIKHFLVLCTPKLGVSFFPTWLALIFQNGGSTTTLDRFPPPNMGQISKADQRFRRRVHEWIVSPIRFFFYAIMFWRWIWAMWSSRRIHFWQRVFNPNILQLCLSIKRCGILDVWHDVLTHWFQTYHISHYVFHCHEPCFCWKRLWWSIFCGWNLVCSLHVLC